MGKVTSIKKFKGKVGNEVYYLLNGQKIVRQVASKRKGPKTQAQKNNELNNTEFAKAASAGKNLRNALAEECERMNDRYLYQRVNKLMLDLKACDVAEKGLKTPIGGLETPQGQAILRDFTFHKKYGSFPKLNSAIRQEGNAALHLSPGRSKILGITELQVNLENGDSRKHLHPAPIESPKNIVELKLNFRRKKGYTELLFIWGEKFLQGVVVADVRC
ncbi:hypothetical protein [Kaistella montana]|uniref:Uncharacterized protein n=1 Tax=Kaistella montana TaxID=1849733 RepID=A0ABW5KB35_9FLAO|nr:hypothetical protein [Kaistella montana]MCQ4035179.1 hypothetical protein [Kaistella montana]